MENARKASSPGARRTAFWLGLALTAIIVGLNVNPCTANDLFWQLRAGQEIVSTHRIPHQDTYSWTRPGTEWVAHEWLAFALFWLAYDCGGFAGVWLLQTGLLLALFLLLYRFLLRETQGASLTSFLLAVGAAYVANVFFQPRPHLFSYLFLTLTLGTTLTVQRSPETWRRLFWLSPVFLVWANLHAGVLTGLIALALFAFGETLDGLGKPRDDAERGRRLQFAARLGGTTLVCGLSTLATPYGWKLYHNVGATLGNTTAMSTVVEWFSPNFHEAHGRFLEAFLALVVVGLLFSRQPRGAASLLLLAAFAHAAFAAQRNVPLFALVGALLLARHAQSALEAFLARFPSNSSPSLFGSAPPARTLFAVGSAFVLLSSLRAVKIALDSKEPAAPPLERIARLSFGLASFPEGACRFLERMQLPTTLRLYNDYDYGGYLIWRLPQYLVFIDGRADIYFGRVLDDYVQVHRLAYRWQSVLASYRPDVALLSAQSSQARLFLASPEWALVYADSPDLDSKERLNMLMFVRDAPPNAALIARCRLACPTLPSDVVRLATTRTREP